MSERNASTLHPRRFCVQPRARLRLWASATGVLLTLFAFFQGGPMDGMGARVLATFGPQSLSAQSFAPQSSAPQSFAPQSSAPQALEDLVWVSVTLERILAERDYPGALALGSLHRLAAGIQGGALASGPASDTYIEAVTWLAGAVRSAQGVDRCRALRDPSEGMLCALETLLPQAPASLVQALSSEGRSILTSELRAQAGATLLDPFQRYAEQVLEEAALLRGRVALLDGDLPYFDPLALLGRVVGSDLRGDTASLLARARGLEGLVRAHPSVLSVQASLSDGQGVLDAYGQYLNSLTASAQGWLDGAQGLEGRAREVRDRATDRAMIYLTRQAATLAGVETSVTERIRVFGNAAADLQLEGSAFLKNARELGQQAALGLLSGNMLSVATGVASFLQLTPGAFGPDAARELREIREILDGVESEVRAGFEGLDARFDELFHEVDRGFDRMERLVVQNHAVVVAELGEIRGDLSALERRTERFEATVTAYLQAGFDRDHARTLIRCLEHRERFLLPMGAPVFRECLTDFRARGARDARDALLSDRTTPVDDPSLIRAFSNHSLENLARSLPLLARAAEQRFGYPGLLGGRGGGNPVEWSVSAEAYLAMLADWPDLSEEVGPADLEALLAVGIELQEILRALVADPVTGEVATLADRVIAEYGRGLRAAVDEADRLARRYQQAQLRRVDPSSILTRVRPASGVGPEFELPRHMAAGIPTELRTATVLALEAPVLVYRTHTADSISLENLRRRWTFFGRDHDRKTFTQTTLEIELRRANGEVVQSWQVTGPQVLRRTEVMAGREGSTQVRSVREQVRDPEAHFLSTIYPVLAGSPAEWVARGASRGLLTELGVGIEAELRRFESASLNRVFGVACQTGPPSEPLDAEDLSSALRLRTALETMTAARVLLGAIVGLALPPERQRTEALAARLNGPDGLLDRDQLCGIVAAGDSPLRVVWLESVPTERMESLSVALRDQLGAVVTPGGPESARPIPRTLVDEAVDGLRWAIRIQRLPRSVGP